MNDERVYVKYVCCPKCGKKLFKTTQKSTYVDIYVWCKNCKKEIKCTQKRANEPMFK